jgi:XTP/dITP diphosphohydrolase
MSKATALQILIATRNPGKIRELQEGLRSLPVKLRLLEEFAGISPVEEIGRTYQENASLKALGYAKQTGVCALADDSGLEVKALGRGPGVFSARFGGQHLSDCQRTERLLTALDHHSDSARAARFVCSMALAGWQPDEEQTETAEPRLLSVNEGICDGLIARDARGLNGFGFDPVFIPNGYGQTFGELPAEVKEEISHRARALAAMRLSLNRWLELDPLSADP